MNILRRRDPADEILTRQKNFIIFYFSFSTVISQS